MKTKKKNMGGRKPGSWTLLTQEQLKSWRLEKGVSRLRLARALGVSPTSVQNWEVGIAVPTTASQQKLLDVMKTPDRIPAKGTVSPALAFVPSQAQTDLLKGGDLHNVVGAIVATYVSAGAKTLTPQELPDLVRSVRSALVG